MKLPLAALLLLAAGAAHAFTPETGLWWNPDESGRGFSIEVQDETLVLTVYVYTPDGEPVFYQGVGELSDKFVAGELSRKSNGQCITCEYREPVTEIGFAGPFEIQFTSETTGVLTWEGGEVPIERFIFGYSELQRMLGEWQMVVDFSAANDGAFFASGDILRFDHLDEVEGQTQFQGYRVDSQFDRTGNGLGDAAGAFEPGNGLHVIVVDDRSDRFLIYYLTVGTKSFEGIAELYDKGSDPTGEGFPVQGFRTARRLEVQAKSSRIELSGKNIATMGLQTPLTARFGVASDEAVSLKSLLGKPVDMRVLQEVVRRLTEALDNSEKY